MEREGLPPLARRRALAVWLAAGICLSVAAITWFGGRALREWRQSSGQLLQRRADEAARLLVTALMRDMHAVQQSPLLSGSWDESMEDVPSLTSDAVASTFATYPYPESFFLWNAHEAASVVFFTRSDRPPAWAEADQRSSGFPVTVGKNPHLARLLVARLQADAKQRRRFSAFQVMVGDTDYQVVTRLYYVDQYREAVRGAFGFTVNLSWVRRFYFPELTRQMSRISDASAGLTMTIFDDQGSLITSSAGASVAAPGATTRRPFEVAFFDPRLVAISRPADLPRHVWAVEVSAFPDPPLAIALRTASRMLIITALATATLAIGLLLTARAVRASASLTELRSEFVSTVTHELKAPIATIRAIGDTLASGRISGPDAQRDYARLVVQESKRLTRLVDNLLAMSRITDVTEAYSFEPQSVSAALDAALQDFRQQLQEGGFELQVAAPNDLPEILADSTAIHLMLDNILHNAIRYSDRVRSIHISARVVERDVRIEITDRGRGIPADEIHKVTRKFFRGHRVVTGGSGLGMAIVQRIVVDHNGRLEIHSVVDAGTTIAIHLPIAGGHHEEAHTGG
jgi:signal transduction histidine kinase